MDDNEENNLSAHDPYRSLRTSALRSMRPTLPSDRKSEAAAESLRSVEASTMENTEKKELAAGQHAAKAAEESPAFQNNVSGISLGGKQGKVKGKLSIKKIAPLFAIIGVLGGGIGLVALAAPVLLPKFLDTQLISKVYSIMPDATDWVIYKYGDLLSGGKVPKSLLNSLQKSGISVGKLLSSGQFSAINAENPNGDLLASTTLVATNNDDGDMDFPLSMEYKGVVYTASEAVTALHTNPELYAAFKQALGGNEAILNSRVAKETYETLEIDNSLYENFTLSGNGEADQNAFEELFAKILLNATGTSISGVEEIEDQENGTYQAATGIASSGISSEDATEAARKYITEVAENTTGRSVEEATLAAAAKLNAAISANESYQSARMYHSLVYPIRLSLDDKGGAINQVMNMLTESKTSYYIDSSTGEKIEQTGPAIQAKALRSAISDLPFSAEDAKGYSRDRGVNLQQIQNEAAVNSGTGIYAAIRNTVISIGSILQNIANFISSLIFGTIRADVSVLVAAFTPSISQALFENTAESFVGLAMGTRGVEGAAFINAKLAQNAGGAMAADSAAIAEHDKHVQELLALDAAADRATHSPFDISSPNTFLGSIMNKLAISTATSSGVVGNVLSVASTMTRSFSSLVPGAHAAANNSYHLTMGNCSTENTIGGQGDMFCNPNPAFDYSTIELTMDDYKTILGSALNSDGSINQNSTFAEYVIFHSDRESSPGVKDANICEAINEASGNWFTQALHFMFGDALSLNNSCAGRSESIATGSEYLYSSGNPYWDCGYKYFQGYMMSTFALELMGYYAEQGTENPTVALREEYYKEYPKDNSYSGILARRSGLSKEEVIAGIQAVNYLAYLENYDPSERLAFSEPQEAKEASPVFEENTDFTYIAATEPNYIVFSDLRSRTKIA